MACTVAVIVNSQILIDAVADDVCSLPVEPGMCMAYFPRYYYSTEAKMCKQFIYGGCGGNKNNFETIEECNARCVK